MGKIREGRWNCSSCGSEAILGRLKECPSCGNPRDKHEAFYLAGGEPAITGSELLQQARAGQDWLCGSCGSSNRADVGRCPNCGVLNSALEEPKKKKRFSIKRLAIPQVEITPQRIPSIEESIERLTGYQVEPIVERRWRDYKWWALGLLATVVLLIGLMFAFKTSSRLLTIAGHTWERSIEIEKYLPFTEEDWSVPTGGRVLDSWSDIHHYNKVFDHYEDKQVSYQEKTGTRTVVTGQRDLGNGFFEDIEREDDVYETRYKTEREEVYRNDPVYETKYKYEIYRWVYYRSDEALGADTNPHWPAVTLGLNEREGTRHEKYLLSLKDDKETYLHPLPLTDWQALENNNTVVGTFNLFGGLRAISGLEAAE